MPEDIDKYRTVYKKGWDAVREERWKRMKEKGIVDTELSSREEGLVPHWSLSEEELREKIGPGEVGWAVAWDTLTEEQKDYQATKMAIHAAMIERMDTEIGRVIEQLKKMDAYKNTLIFFASDNGASAEQYIVGDLHDKNVPLGSAKSFVCLGPGWSTAANTPFKLHKHWTHEGGIASPLVVRWPDGIKARGELRTDVSHFIDIAPTILELAGGTWPKQTEDDVAVQHHKRQAPIALVGIVPTEVEDGSLLPVFQPEVAGNPTVVFIHTPVVLAPAIELTGRHAQPADEARGADLGSLRPAPHEIDHLVPYVVRDPGLGQS